MKIMENSMKNNSTKIMKMNVKIIGKLSFFKFQYYSDVEQLCAKILLFNNLFNVHLFKILFIIYHNL